MYMRFKGTFRELLKFVPVGIPEFSSKSGKRPLVKLSEEELLVLCVCISLTLVKRSLVLDGTDKRETSNIGEETVSA